MPLSAAINTVGNLANSMISYGFQKQLMKQQFDHNEQAAINADARQRAQYHDMYSPTATLEQYKAAGLSPSMMLSGGAPTTGGNAQGAQGAGVSQPQYPNIKIFDPLTNAQIEDLRANVELKKSQTALNNANKDFTLSNIIKLAEETKNVQWQNKLLEIQKGLDDIKLKISQETTEDQIKQIQAQAENVYQNSLYANKQNEELQLKINYDKETYTTRINQLTANYKNTLKDFALKESQINLNEEQINNLIQTVSIKRLEMMNEKTRISDLKNFYEAEVNQWAKENKIHITDRWVNFAAQLIGSACNLGAVALK